MLRVSRATPRPAPLHPLPLPAPPSSQVVPTHWTPTKEDALHALNTSEPRVLAIRVKLRKRNKSYQISTQYLSLKNVTGNVLVPSIKSPNTLYMTLTYHISNIFSCLKMGIPSRCSSGVFRRPPRQVVLCTATVALYSAQPHNSGWGEKVVIHPCLHLKELAW